MPENDIGPARKPQAIVIRVPKAVMAINAVIATGEC